MPVVNAFCAVRNPGLVGEPWLIVPKIASGPLIPSPALPVRLKKS